MDRNILSATRSRSNESSLSFRFGERPSFWPIAPKRPPGVWCTLVSGHERVEESIQRAAARYNLSPELIRSVIRAESNFHVDAVSPAGAKGLMQLMPETAKELGVTNVFDVQQNIDGGARYLRQMLDRFGGDTKRALAAYNAGPGAVEQFNGNVPYAETRQYVKRVMRSAGLG